MARLFFKSLVFSPAYISTIYFRIIWIVLTCIALRVLIPKLYQGHAVRWKPEVTELDKFIFDLTLLWDANVIWFCFILSFGTLVASSSEPDGTDVQGVDTVLFFLYRTCFLDFITFYATHRKLKSRGFDIIARYCKGVKPEDMASLDFGALCHRSIPDLRAKSFLLMTMWKCIGLGMMLLAAYWLRCARLEEIEFRDKAEGGMQEDEGQAIVRLVKPTKEENIDVENSV